MIELYFDTETSHLPAPSDNLIPVYLFGRSAKSGLYASIGGAVLDELRRIEEDINETAFDFLTIALAITAADTFIERERKAADGWCREIKVNLPLIDPKLWDANKDKLKKILHFLSGDIWELEFRKSHFPLPKKIKKGRKISLIGHDSTCLFSGGLDSAIGVIDLTKQNKKPVLISHAYPKDKAKQDEVYNKLNLINSKFQVLANPRRLENIPADVQMRTRSFNFIAFGTIIATAISKHYKSGNIVKLFIPENGLISINPPLTPRRIGSLSTRTTHPFFLKSLNELFTSLSLPVLLTNPYQFKTKGEMMKECLDSTALKNIAVHTVSCGKWKRSGVQCGKCVPCLIRRASFHVGNIRDDTRYSNKDLDLVVKNPDNRDDLMSMILAVRKLKKINNPNIWVSKSGFLPVDPTVRYHIINTVVRGFKEVEDYLLTQPLGINI